VKTVLRKLNEHRRAGCTLGNIADAITTLCNQWPVRGYLLENPLANLDAPFGVESDPGVYAKNRDDRLSELAEETGENVFSEEKRAEGVHFSQIEPKGIEA
jgi:hypothetical protein